MLRSVSTVLALAGSLALTGCASPAPEMNAAGDIAAINALRTSFMTAFNSGDAAAMGNLYTADAVSNPNHAPSVTGRDAIVANQKTTFDQVTMKIDIVPDETRTMGNFGFDRGHFTMTITPKAGGPTMTDQGRYLVLLEKDSSGAWRVTRDIDNSSMPMPMPPPPAAVEGEKPK